MRNNLRGPSGAITWPGLAALVLASALAGCKASRHPGVGSTSDAADDRGGNPGSDGGGGGDARAGGDLGTGGGPGSDGAADRSASGREAGSDGAGPGSDVAGGDTAAGGGDAGSAGDAGFGAGCNTLAPGAPVTVVCAGDGGVTSTPAGGTIAAGTYVLTALTAFGPCIALDVAQTLIIGATTIETVVQDSITGVSRASSTYILSGDGGASSQLVETNTCPDTTTRTLGFTAAGNTLTLYSNDSGTTTVAVLTRQ